MIQTILDKARSGQRLSTEEGLQLLQSRDLTALGSAANDVTERLHPETYRTYNIDRNINYTNICTAVCDFCAFYRTPKSEEGYVLPREVLHAKIEETLALGGNQILLQGGLHPHFKLDWYEEMLSDIKSRFPTINIHGFSPPEIYHFTKVNKLPLRDVLARLKAAGLGSLPGGGAEILVDRVRTEITRGKVLTDDWLNVMRVWHELGGISSATMMFGHVETLEERIEHLDRLRQLQDETGGFTAFICWTFQPDHTQMSHIPPAGAFEYIAAESPTEESQGMGADVPPCSDASSDGMPGMPAPPVGGCAGRISCLGGNGNPDCSCSTLRWNRCSKCCSSNLATSISAGDARGRSLK